MAGTARQSEVVPPREDRKLRPGRPTPERIAEIAAKIHEAALHLFLELGFEATSMDAIAVKAGVSKGTLYARYLGKEALFRAILEQELERWSARAGASDHLLPDALTPRLRHHAQTLLQVFGWPEYQRIARLLNAAAPALPDLASYWKDIGTGRYLNFLAKDMEKAVPGRECDWQFYARVFLFAISGWFHQDGCKLGEEAATAYVDGVVALIVAAVEA